MPEFHWNISGSQNSKNVLIPTLPIALNIVGIGIGIKMEFALHSS